MNHSIIRIEPKKFKEYLQKHNHKGINIHLKAERQPTEEKLNILTQPEIKQLFSATKQSHHKKHFRQRDKAILTLLYSCGLRRNEAVHLDLSDIFFDKERVFVRKGKTIKKGLCQSTERMQKYWKIISMKPAWNLI